MNNILNKYKENFQKNKWLNFHIKLKQIFKMILNSCHSYWRGFVAWDCSSNSCTQRTSSLHLQKNIIKFFFYGRTEISYEKNKLVEPIIYETAKRGNLTFKN